MGQTPFSGKRELKELGDVVGFDKDTFLELTVNAKKVWGCSCCESWRRNVSA